MSSGTAAARTNGRTLPARAFFFSVSSLSVLSLVLSKLLFRCVCISRNYPFHSVAFAQRTCCPLWSTLIIKEVGKLKKWAKSNQISQFTSPWILTQKFQNFAQRSLYSKKSKSMQKKKRYLEKSHNNFLTVY